MRTNCPHEDRRMSPHPRPHRLFHMTVLVLVLILIWLQILILVLEDRGPVLVPSLRHTGNIGKGDIFSSIVYPIGDTSIDGDPSIKEFW